MTKRLLALLTALLMVLAACGGDDATDTTQSGDTEAPATTEAEPADTTTADTSADTTDTTGSDAPSGEGVLMGLLAPYSGELGTFGEIISNGYIAGAETINATGLLDCGPIEFITADEETNPEVGRQEAERMISQGVVAIAGPTSDVLVALVPLMQSEQVVVTSPYAGTTAFNELGGDYAFRTVGPDTNDGLAAAKWIADQGYESVAVFTQQEEQTLSAGNAARAALADLGVNVAFDQEFAPGEASYSGTLSTVLAANPDVIYLAGGQESSLTIINEAIQLGYAGDWLFSADLATDETLQAIGADALEGVGYTVVSSTDQTTDEYQQFVSLFEEHIGGEPGPFAANAFDGMTLIGLAMVASGGCDGPSINSALVDVSSGGTPVTSFEEGAQLLAEGEDIDYQGASGPVDLDDSGSVTNSYSVQQVQEGAWQDIQFYPAEELQELG
ncbi:MAG TPA: ABC transporter substrate-binding protein [Acidimicrobiia bacterium]|nr:ABC transporter substrate-binding protein [Acidimicrobiia bacterium]